MRGEGKEGERKEGRGMKLLCKKIHYNVFVSECQTRQTDRQTAESGGERRG